jgi:hypothetical protein
MNVLRSYWNDFKWDIRATLAAAGHSTFHRRLLRLQAGSDALAELLRSGWPAMITRFGFTERGCVLFFHQYRAAGQPYPARTLRTMSDNSGFFPATPENLDRFSALYLDAVKSADAMCLWLMPGEEVLCREFCPAAILVEPRSLEPYYNRRPWSAVLAGKKVLVVHPFARSIERQYHESRPQLFRNPDVLPAFELKTVPAVQSLGNPAGFPDWFAALAHMQRQIAATDFDIALIGAGAYGLPLAAFVKSLGKQAVHLGGAAQLLFGIKGRRWDNYPRMARLYNEHWARPLPEERPSTADKVEGGCYW